MAGLGLAGAALAACGATPAPTKAPAQEATTAPEATAAPVEQATPAPASGGGKKLVFSSYTWSGYEDAMKQVLAMWKEKNPGVEVEGQFVGEDYWTKVQTQIASGSPPDVGIGEWTRPTTWAKSGILLQLDEMVQRDNYPTDKFLPATIAQYSWKEGAFDSGGEGAKIFGLPSDAQGWIFVYNKDLFDAAGVAPPSDDWTWDDLVTAGQKLTNPDEDKWAIDMPCLWCLLRGNFVYAAGGDFQSADYKQSALDSPETIEAYKWVWDLIYTEKICLNPGAVSTDPFASGQVAMSTGGVWMIADWANITDFEWDMAQLPKHPRTGKRTTSAESDGWWVYKGTKERELAWNMCGYLASEEAQKKFGELGFVVPGSIPAVAKAYYEQKPPDGRINAFNNLVNDSKKVGNSFFEAQSIAGMWNPILEQAYFDGEDIEVKMKEAAQIMNEELAKSWEKFLAS